jgi:hypothetical protein
LNGSGSRLFGIVCLSGDVYYVNDLHLSETVCYAEVSLLHHFLWVY